MIGASLGQGLGWKTREKKNTARNNSFAIENKKKGKMLKEIKRRKTPQYNRNIQNFQKSRITIKLLNVNDKIERGNLRDIRRKKGWEDFCIYHSLSSTIAVELFFCLTFTFCTSAFSFASFRLNFETEIKKFGGPALTEFRYF